MNKKITAIQILGAFCLLPFTLCVTIILLGLMLIEPLFFIIMSILFLALIGASLLIKEQPSGID